VNWLFRNRQTGEITIAQAPNAPLLIWLLATIARVVFDPSGWFGTALTIVATVSLIVWSLDELVRGVNPFRRMLGAVILTLQMIAIWR
jgi:hypothetical protein